MQLNIDMRTCPTDLKQGLAEIEAMFPERFADTQAAVTVRMSHDPARAPGHAVSVDGDVVAVTYCRTVDAFRAIGRLGGADDGVEPHDETARFTTQGVMFDTSRNAVLNIDSARSLLRRLALMGVNMLMFYTEDTYEVPDEPFFGYLRGRYTIDELKGLDDYAALFGIEMIPCIQALGHLGQILQWPAYEELQDNQCVLLADDEKTYALLCKMIAAATAPYRSNRIHIGMDEAHGVGTGRFKKLFGDQEPFDILNRHLRRVRDICTELALQPMIWSDMYFRLGSATYDYYDLEAEVPDRVRDAIPDAVDLVYWDYYHQDPEFYAAMIDRHRALGVEPLIAAGIWTWGRFWAHLPVSMGNMTAFMSAGRDKGVKEALVTIWGDDGTECDLFSALAGLQLFAELGYADDVDEDVLHSNFRGSCDEDFAMFTAASGLDVVPCVEEPAVCVTNISKILLWQDPFLSIYDPVLAGVSLRQHYEVLAVKLATGSDRLKMPAQLARTLALKCELRTDLAAAYTAGDTARLRALLDGDVSALIDAVDDLWHCHRGLWFDRYKPFGWEVVEGRYGGLRARLDTVRTRLEDYLSGRIAAIPELEVQLDPGFPDADSADLPYSTYDRLVTPSSIK